MTNDVFKLGSRVVVTHGELVQHIIRSGNVPDQQMCSIKNAKLGQNMNVH